MSSIYRETLSSMNEVLSGIRKNQEDFPDQKNFVTFVTFEGKGMCGVNRRRDRVPIERMADLTEKDYNPRGTTPLYDAIGKTLTNLEGLVHKDDRVIATVITDGYENSSEEYSGRAIKALVDRLREKGWTLAYIGANQDAVEVARDLHIDNALDFDANGEGIALMSVKLKKARTKASIMWSMTDNEELQMPLTGLFSPDPDENVN